MAAKKDQWVLVVDDDPDVRELLVDDLVDQFDGNLRIVEASDGVQASNKLDNQAFDCIVTDLKMPKRDGDHFIEWVRESTRNRHVPIVVVTGYPEPRLVDKYPNIHFLDKPVDFKLFGQTIKTQLKLGRLDKRLSADLFNATVDSTRRFCSKILDAIPVVERPVPKTAEEDFQGEVLTFLSARGPSGRCDIVIGFDKALLELLAPNMKHETEKLAMAAISTIGAHMLKAYHQQNLTKKPPVLEGKKYLPRTSPGYPTFSKSVGLKVPVTIYDHTIHLTMITKKSG